jgi:GTP-binding protein YchF
MRLGIIGLPAAGKTTVFNALTGASLPVGTLAPTQEVHTAVVDVPDTRVDRLSQLFHPKKTTYAKVTYADVGGLTAESAQTGLPGPLLNQLQQMDGLLQVVRAFDDPSVPHSLGTIDPLRDQRQLHDELMLNDMLAVERRLERLNEEHQRGGRDRSVVSRELALFERFRDTLAEERALRELVLTPDEEKSLSGFGLLTRKPWLVVVNLGEGQAPPNWGDLGSGVGVLPLQGRLEMEIAQMPAEEIDAFLSEYAISEPGRVRVIQASYQLLDLMSFFTVGEDEVRAWTLIRGASALEAAAAIHTDLARGFIRAEVVGWEEVLALGGWSQAREAGKLRIEGKEYSVKDGDILHVRFNI